MSTPAMDTLELFYAHALAIEREAAQRYQELADQMLEHNNQETADLFLRLARLESEHAERLAAKTAGMRLPALKPWDYQWTGLESPESAAYETAHYLMKPHHALQVALENEQRAKAFFESIARTTLDADVKRLAAEMAGEEAEHVGYVEKALASVAPPTPDWAEDLDRPQEAD